MTVASSDTFLREREDHDGIQEKPPESQVYTAYIARIPVTFTTKPSLYEVAEDGSVTIIDTDPPTMVVDTDEDGSVTVQVPV